MLEQGPKFADQRRELLRRLALPTAIDPRVQQLAFSDDLKGVSSTDAAYEVAPAAELRLELGLQALESGVLSSRSHRSVLDVDLQWLVRRPRGCRSDRKIAHCGKRNG